MADTDGYNGWSNYETWVMALWINNDQDSYNTAREIAQDVTTTADIEGRDRAGMLATALASWQEDSRPDQEASVWLDLVFSAFARINWHEIAFGILSETADA